MRAIFHLLWWAPLPIVLYGMQAWLSVKNTEGGSWKWPMCLWIASAMPLWAYVSRFYDKKDLNFVGGVYDILLFLTFQITWMVLGCCSSFNRTQWVGLFVVIIGFILIKAPISE